jgi:hypothetical protein
MSSYDTGFIIRALPVGTEVNRSYKGRENENRSINSQLLTGFGRSLMQ